METQQHKGHNIYTGNVYGDCLIEITNFFGTSFALLTRIVFDLVRIGVTQVYGELQKHLQYDFGDRTDGGPPKGSVVLPHVQTRPGDMVNEMQTLIEELESRLAEASSIMAQQKETIAIITSKLQSEDGLIISNEKEASIGEEQMETTRVATANYDVNKRLPTKLSRRVSSVKVHFVLRDRYDKICTTEWLDAMDAFQSASVYDEDLHKKTVYSLLCSVFMISQEMTKEIHKTMISRIQKPDFHPRMVADKMDSGVGSSIPSLPLPLEITGPIFDARSLKKIIILGMCDLVKTKCLGCYPDIDQEFCELFRNNEDIHAYITEVCHLSYCMALQMPPMVFDASQGLSQRVDESLHIPYYLCNPDDPDSVVEYFITPILYHEGIVLSQGKVFLCKT